jgi:hypothetical protein
MILLVGAVVGVLLGGCALQASPPPTAPPISPSPVVRSGPPPTPIPTARAGDGQIDPSSFLQVCDGWPGDSADDPVQCDHLVQTALRGLPAGDPLLRVDTSYSCVSTCKPLDPHRGYVIVTTSGGSVEVEVSEQADGSYAVTETTPIEPPDQPAFEAPPASAPALEGVPHIINQRQPLPQCGVETRDMGGPFDTPARQCFWDGIRAGSPVEFVSITPDTEGLVTITIYRYTGSGAVEMVSNDEGGYWRTSTGIGPATEPGSVFGSDGLQTERDPIPAD